jgi:hypothetical protein
MKADEMRRDAEETLSVVGKEDCLAHSQVLAAYVLALLGENTRWREALEAIAMNGSEHRDRLTAHHALLADAEGV